MDFDNPRSVRKHLSRLLKKYCPKRLKKLDDMMVKWEGNYDALFSELEERYNVPHEERVIHLSQPQPAALSPSPGRHSNVSTEEDNRVSSSVFSVSPPKSRRKHKFHQQEEQQEMDEMTSSPKKTAPQEVLVPETKVEVVRRWDPDRNRERLLAFCLRHKPARVAKVNKCLSKWAGQENELFEMLAKESNVPYSETQLVLEENLKVTRFNKHDPDVRLNIRYRILKICEGHAQQRLKKLEHMFERWNYHEIDLLIALHDKYEIPLSKDLEAYIIEKPIELSDGGDSDEQKLTIQPTSYYADDQQESFVVTAAEDEHGGAAAMERGLSATAGEAVETYSNPDEEEERELHIKTSEDGDDEAVPEGQERRKGARWRGPGYARRDKEEEDDECIKKDSLLRQEWFRWLIAFLLLLLLILISLCFQYVDRQSMGFKKNRSSKKVDTTRVYHTGRYMWGPAYTIIQFPTSYQKVSIDKNHSIAVSTDQGQKIILEFNFWYRMSAEKLELIFKTFARNFEERITKIAVSKLRNLAPQFSIQELMKDRATVRDKFWEGVSVELAEKAYVEVPHKFFFMEHIKLPPIVLEQTMDIVVRQQSLFTREWEYQVEAVRLNTSKIVTALTNQRQFLLASANTNASRLVSNAQNDAQAQIEAEKGKQTKNLFTLFDTLGINTTRVQKRLLTYLSVLDRTSPTGVVSGWNEEVMVRP